VPNKINTIITASKSTFEYLSVQIRIVAGTRHRLGESIRREEYYDLGLSRAQYEAPCFRKNALNLEGALAIQILSNVNKLHAPAAFITIAIVQPIVIVCMTR
jgi:hypothetical protein